MFIAPLLSVGCGILLSVVYPAAIWIAAPLLILWFLAPVLASYLSRPVEEGQPVLTDKQTLFLHKTARKTWSFFEQFVTAEEHWLPPDNFQDEPAPKIAHRTSPTNMGLCLLANLTAYDFGYISGSSLILKCNQTLQSMFLLERFGGHFYNWYDTLSLLPLSPRYISTVDSGNLAGHLLTLRQGLIALPAQPVFDKRIFEGLRTTAHLVLDFAKGSDTEVATQIIAILDTAVLQCDSLYQIRKYLDELCTMTAEFDHAAPGAYNWTGKLTQQAAQIREDLVQLIPWITLLPFPSSFPDLDTEGIPSLNALKEMAVWQRPALERYRQGEISEGQELWLSSMTSLSEACIRNAEEKIGTLKLLAGQCETLSDIEYGFLLDKSTNLCSIGYNVDAQKRDDSYYDLLASEVRLGIFVAIAQNKLPQESWFALGRLLTHVSGDSILLSWSGSMFEYLMPQLVMPVYENTLLHQTGKASVKRQIDYAGQRDKPWGISESAYNAVDANLNYQYRAFGVPGLGLKRGLEEDMVIAPYATMLALMVAPEKALCQSPGARTGRF